MAARIGRREEGRSRAGAARPARPVRRAIEAARARWGRRAGWWPGESPFEIALGAVLVQNTAWRNAQLALVRMREAELFDVRAIGDLDLEALEAIIRPAGTYRRKARTIRALAGWFADRPGATVEEKLAGPLDAVRRSLLAVPGVGPETAAAILLYAGGRPVFVPDAYAKRILVRHGRIEARAGPAEVAAWFERATPASATLYAELHAHVVSTAQEHCRPREACCDACPFLEL